MLRAGLAAIIALGAAAGLAQTTGDDELRRRIVGYWGDTEDCQGGVMVFRSEGSMVQMDIDFKRVPPTIILAEGAYTVQGGNLSGTMNGRPMPTVGIRFDKDRLYFVEGRDESFFVNCPTGPR